MAARLTELDYYRANDPGWLKMNPEKQRALIDIQSHCLPRYCYECYFCKRDFEEGKKFNSFLGFSCALDGHKCPDEAKSDECPLDKEERE